MSDQKRPYKMKRRAELEEQTRQRITESAVALHGTLGPARTTVSAVADHAGVRRSTVYRHFPDEEALFGACSAHWAMENPPPDIEAWSGISDPDERLATALGELYGFYRDSEGMLANLFRDRVAVAVVDQLMGAYDQFMAAAVEVLLAGRGLRGKAKAQTRAALGHALEFSTWRSLARGQGLDDVAAGELMTRLVAAA
ncbi:MAG TPA: TetR/AcrR family transcriptional regulator [Solirubrobacterales bacterium]|nr:TetR/AcrR family transcriptional regulator [Solirubrobacterales bacterium]